MAAPNAAQDKRVLSIQSHVVAGYVGNKAATFPLQLLGWEVDQVNTVEFSNHTGYGRWGGSKFDAAHLEDVFNALEINGLFRQSRILTGYVPGADALSVVASKVRKLKAANPAITYVLDPVMGDDGRIYVSQAVIPIYKNLLTQATCTTPNYFEAELLTDVKIVDAASLRLALSLFHQRYGIPHVIISAVALPLEQIRSLGLSTDGSDEDAKWLVCAGSSQTSSGSSVAFGLAFPQLAEHYEGVGDVFSSLVTAHFDSPEGSADSVSPLAHTAELAIGSLQGILLRTRENALRVANNEASIVVPRSGETGEERVRRLRTVELRLIQSAPDILHPNIRHRAHAI